MCSGYEFVLAFTDQTLPSVLLDDPEHHEARLLILVFDLKQEALVDERRDTVQNVLAAYAAHRLDRFER